MFFNTLFFILANFIFLLLSLFFENIQLINWEKNFLYNKLPIGIKFISCIHLILLIVTCLSFQIPDFYVWITQYVPYSTWISFFFIFFYFWKNYLIIRLAFFRKEVLRDQIKELLLRLSIYLLLSFFLWNYKFQYSLLLYFLICPELFFISLMSLIFFERGYNRIIIFKIDLSSSSIIEIWFELIRIKAFKRFYIVLSRKANPTTIILSLFIFFFSIPVRIGELLFALLNFDLTTSLQRRIESLYYFEYGQVKHLKIEIIDGQIELNCVSLGKLSNKLILNKSERQKAFDVLVDLKRASINFASFEEKKNSIRLQLANVWDEGEKNYIQQRHYVYKENTNTIHPTSSRPKILLNNQKIEIFMSSTVKLNSKNPVTIISERVGKVEFSNDFIVVSPFELNVVKYLNPNLFKLSITDMEYTQKKIAIYENIITSNLGSRHLTPIELKTIIKELSMNHYTTILFDATNKDFKDLIERQI